MTTRIASAPPIDAFASELGNRSSRRAWPDRGRREDGAVKVERQPERHRVAGRAGTKSGRDAVSSRDGERELELELTRRPAVSASSSAVGIGARDSSSRLASASRTVCDLAP
jgi:hypothetical protein